jgi:hypothetical protein
MIILTPRSTNLEVTVIENSVKRRLLEKHLRDCGCVFDHAGGRHDVWFNPKNGRQAPVPRHGEINTFTARGVCKQLGVSPPPSR